MSLDARVGIVLVSHSAELAEGAAALAAQISGGTVAIIPAGGTDEGQLGTSAAKVQRALKLADSGAGVVILPDLGSADSPSGRCSARPVTCPRRSSWRTRRSSRAWSRPRWPPPRAPT